VSGVTLLSEISMLERLMDRCEAYKKDSNNKYNPRALTKLLKNYRSHPVIMHQPNVMFYDGELLPAGDSDIHEAVNWEALPNPKFPMVFHGVVGIEQREKTSPSFFNIQEIQVVSQYLDKLIGHKMQNVVVKEEHVGIVTPYKKQADKIRRLCTKKRYSEDLLVGSVEQFQGTGEIGHHHLNGQVQMRLLELRPQVSFGIFGQPKGTT
jgi:helicase MOV-10